jgi:hypothetical protein
MAGALAMPAATPAAAPERNERRFMKSPLFAWYLVWNQRTDRRSKLARFVKTLAILGGAFGGEQ